MRRIITTLILLASAGIFNISAPEKAFATTYTYTANPNYPSNKIEAISIRDYGMQCQTLTPTTSTLANYVYAMVDGYDRDATMFIVGLHEANPPESGPQVMPGELVSEYRATTIGAKPNGLTNSLEMTKFTNSSVTEVSVDTSKKYMICIRYSETYNADPDGDGDIVWYSDPTGTYNGGYGFSLGRPLGDGIPGLRNLNYDFGFAIYNKIAEAEQAPADETPDTPAAPTTTTTTTATTATNETNQPSGVTSGNGAAPATPTSSIKAPTELVAADIPLDQGGAIKLDWKASATADIDGYKIFRSTEEKKNFGEVAKTTDKTILTFTDTNATIGTTYYYLVRAYKGTGESASSNTVSAASTDNLAPAAPKNFIYESIADKIIFTWEKNTETDLGGYVLNISNPSSKETIENIEIGKDDNEYRFVISDHLKFVSGTAYEYSLIAKDTHENLSEKTVATEKITNSETAPAVANTANQGNRNYLVWYISGGAAALLLAGALVYWFKFRKKIV